MNNAFEKTAVLPKCNKGSAKVIDNVKFISESYFIAHVMIKYVIWLIFSVV